MAVFISDADEWDRLYRLWNRTDVYDTIYSIRNQISYINDTCLAGTGLEAVPDPTATKLDRIRYQMEELASFCRTIHSKVEDQIDIPFCYELAKITDMAYTINPKELTVTTPAGTNTPISIIDILAPLAAVDEDLKRAFDAAVLEIDNMEPSTTLQQEIVAAIARYSSGKSIDEIDSGGIEVLVKYYEMLNPEHGKIMDDFLSPIMNTGIYDNDIMNIKFISYLAPEPYKELMFIHLPGITIEDNDGCPICRQQGLQYRPHICTVPPQHYVPGEHAIYVNFSNLKSGDGYLTFFHEIGHAIDYAMGLKGTYASAVLFKTLESEVFEGIESTIRQHTQNDDNIVAVLDAILYDGDASKLTQTQIDLYNDVISEYIKAFHTDSQNNPQNGTVSMIYGGFTENVLIFDPNTGNRVGRGHTKLGYYYNNDSPTGAQNREFFADHFSVNIIQDTGKIDANKEFFPNTIAETDEIIQSGLNSGRG
jgi:hypothetical protein